MPSTSVTRRTFIAAAAGAAAAIGGGPGRVQGQTGAPNRQVTRAGAAPQPYASFHPGKPWYDTEGKLIQAHAGSVIVVDDLFYWYGENKDHTLPGSDVWTWGVRCYSSKDLYNWKDVGLIVPPKTDDPSSPLHPTQMLDRPHIIYNRRTKKFVCWLKIMEKDFSAQTRTVLVADQILGPYTLLAAGIHPLGMSGGDFDLYVDPSDGKAYQFFERVHSEMICADLTDDYTGFTGHYSAHLPGRQPPFVREGLAHFVRKATHYLLSSGTTGYHPNPSQIASAPSVHGPWTVLGNPSPNDRSRTSYNSQSCSVFKHPAKKDLYIALADRWIYDLPELEGPRFATGEAYEQIAKVYQREFDPDGGPLTEAEKAHAKSLAQSSDTSKAAHVWLPIRFDEGVPRIDWKDEWRIENYA
jgi:hypothetical protein